MSITNFENIKVTTMTAIVDLEGSAVIEAIFPLLPITRLELKDTGKMTKKFKIPWPGKEYAGCIFSAKYAGSTRGIIKTSSTKSFRNSVAIDICTTVKNVSAKLVKNKIHMCGPNSGALAIETAQHIVDHILIIQKEVDYISSHLIDRDETVKWLIRETKGDNYIINEETQEIIDLQDGEMIRNSVVYDNRGNAKYNYREVPFKWDLGDTINPDNIIVNKYGQPYYRSLTKKEKKDGVTVYPIMKIGEVVKIMEEGVPIDEKGNKFNKVCKFPLRIVEVVSVKIPDSIMKSLSEEKKLVFPKNINSRIAGFLLNYIQDYAYHHILVEFLESFKHISKVYLGKMSIDVNNSIDSGEGSGEGSGNKEMIHEPLKVGGLNIAMINYSYSLGMNVDRWALATLINGQEGFSARYNNTTDHHVTITLPYEKNIKETIVRKHLACISFMVYKSGIVTQSGPSPEIMEPVYYKFMKIIEGIRDKIKIKDDKPFNLKYTPVNTLVCV